MRSFGSQDCFTTVGTSGWLVRNPRLGGSDGIREAEAEVKAEAFESFL